MKKRIDELMEEYKEVFYNMEKGDYIFAPDIWIALKLMSDQISSEELSKSIEQVLTE